MTISEVKKYLHDKESSKYERSQYDAFLTYINFSYVVPSIHITGTNGKGSVAHYLKNIYEASGRKVGLYSSPFLKDINEMIVVNDQMITDDAFVDLFSMYLPLFEQFNLTAFEIETFIAFRYFEAQHVDLSVIEVGMGGLIDATNIFTPILSIITNVTLEHTHYLGRTVEDIALAKAGIIKPEVPILLGQISGTPLQVIQTVASSKHAPLHLTKGVKNIRMSQSDVCFDYDKLKKVRLATFSLYEVLDASIAIEATQALKRAFPLKLDQLYKGLLLTKMPGRMEVMQTNPLVIVDGAHNPAAIRALVDSLKMYQDRPISIVFAAFKDKDVMSEFPMLEELSKDITLTTFAHHRARKQDEYPTIRYPYDYDYERLILRKIKQSPENGIILITGSLAFAGVVRQLWKEVK